MSAFFDRCFSADDVTMYSYLFALASHLFGGHIIKNELHRRECWDFCGIFRNDLQVKENFSFLIAFQKIPCHVKILLPISVAIEIQRFRSLIQHV